MRTIIHLILLALMWTSCQGQPTQLSLNLEKGKTYQQLTDSKASIAQEINGQTMNIEMSIKGSMSYLVTDVNESDYAMDVAYESLSMSMQLPQGTLEFSSEKGEKDIFSSILSEMKNKPFQIKMGKNGTIKEVNNIESLFESAFGKFPQIPENQMAQIKAQIMKAYGKEAFKGNIEMVMAIYPDKSVSKDETWVINTKLEAGMSADMTTTYRFMENNPDYYLITGDSKIQTADKEAYVELNGMPVKYDLSGNMSSEIKVDKLSGWIQEAKIKQDIQGNVFIKANAQMPEGMTIPMRMKNELTYSDN